MANILTRNIPNAITLINLLSGCVAIIFAFSPEEYYGGLAGYEVAFWCIIAGAAADFCDGFSARLLHAKSPIGGDLDSLSDLVTFGVAPAMILLNLLRHCPVAPWLPYTTLLIPLCGALRLAKFNVDTTQSENFKGLPIPSCALFCIGLASVITSESGFNPWAALGCIIFVSLMMISPLRMFSLKLKSLNIRTNSMRYLLVIVALAAIIFLGWAGLMVAIAFYILICLFTNMFILTEAKE